MCVQSSSKKIWHGSDSLLTSVETLQTARARHLQEMYNVLQNDLFDNDERIDILMTVKTTVRVCGSPRSAVDSGPSRPSSCIAWKT